MDDIAQSVATLYYIFIAYWNIFECLVKMPSRYGAYNDRPESDFWSI